MELVRYKDRFYIYWRENKKTRRKALGTVDRAEAERELIDFKKRLAVPNETIDQIFGSYLKAKEGTPRHSVTQYNWKALKPTFANMRPDQVTRQVCIDYTKTRLAKVGSTTVNDELSMLRAALRWHNKSTPAVFEMPPRSPPRDRYLTKLEIHKLLDNAIAPHIKLFIIVAFCTAGRASAILELTWDRVDFHKNIINLSKGNDPKNKRRGLVPMNETVRQALLRAFEARETDFVIEHGRDKVKNVKKGVQAAAQRADLADVSPHVIRHSAAVAMAEGRVPMSEISQYLGHTSTDVTERVYARYSPEFLGQAASTLNL